MNAMRRMLLMAFMSAALWAGAIGNAAAQSSPGQPQEVLHTWYDLTLELVRHTPTYTPPVASRSFAYLGVTAYEAVASGSDHLQSLAGQLNGLKPTPKREADKIYDETVVLQSAMAFAVQSLFENTGPTGQRAMQKLAEKLAARSADGIPTDVAARSEAYGRTVAEHILAWSHEDGGAVIENMGFPLQYELTKGPAHWVPTNLIAQQQKPLLPDWGKTRTFAMPDDTTCALPPPPEYSEDKESQFYKEALEVYQTRKDISGEQATIARFWSDDPMLSQTPPGHWMAIALHILERDTAGIEQSVDVLARLGIAVADAFIGCWQAKYQYDLIRPISYIRRVIDPKWEPLLNTPPFPEYPSGHSTQSSAAALVLTKLFGENFAFDDASREMDGLKPRSFPSFWAAANEAGISRMYGGIHFRAAIERGLEQGRCIGAFANALQTRR